MKTESATPEPSADHADHERFKRYYETDYANRKHEWLREVENTRDRRARKVEEALQAR